MTSQDKYNAMLIFDQLMKKESKRADRYIQHNPSDETRRRTMQSAYNSALADFWNAIYDMPTAD